MCLDSKINVWICQLNNVQAALNGVFDFFVALLRVVKFIATVNCVPFSSNWNSLFSFFEIQNLFQVLALFIDDCDF